LSGTSEAEVIAFLKARAPRQIDTACAHVFLADETAWKIKRHVDLGYADFSTAERRLWALRRELQFNRTAAPDIYRAVRPLTREADGSLALEGQGEPVEYVLEMRRFDEREVLSAKPEAIDGELAEALGRTIAGFHAAAPLRPEGGLSALAFTVGSNAQLLGETCPGLDQARVEHLVALTEAELERQAPLLARRTAAGFARRCHGDLHLGNILMEDGRPVLFDCIEFNDLLSDLDVQYDLAFLLMDLDFRHRRDAAVRVLSAYLDEAGRAFPAALWGGLAALPLMLSVRAGVRAHVEAHSGRDAVARAYVEAAIAHLAPPPASLLAVGGLSGSGKSTFARAAASSLGASPGAVVLRTDEIRKRLLGVPPTQAVSRDAYTPEFYVQTYDTLFANAQALLAAGRAVVLDATFTSPEMRARAERLAADCGVPFEGVWLEAPLPVLEDRVAGRTGDASDATVEVLRGQLQGLDPEISWPRIDTSASAAAAAETWIAGRG
jgi:aminoglycoside phosphotransferase family enzyme/predicted kinase